MRFLGSKFASACEKTPDAAARHPTVRRFSRVDYKMAIDPAEEATIRAFIVPAKRDRYLSLVSNEKRRAEFLDCLNHCRDIDNRYATQLPSLADVISLLRAHGAPDVCRVISDCRDIDGREMPLRDAVEHAESVGWGTILCCIPGRLAYYLDEAGTRRRLLLIRSHDS
jgi:hypothetical protein